MPNPFCPGRRQDNAAAAEMTDESRPMRLPASPACVECRDCASPRGSAHQAQLTEYLQGLGLRRFKVAARAQLTKRLSRGGRRLFPARRRLQVNIPVRI